MKFDIHKSENSLVIRVEGKLDAGTAPELDTALADKMQNVTSVVYDFEELEYISSAGLRTLLATYKRMMKAEGSMRIVNVGAEFMSVLKLSGFADLYEIE